MPAREKNPAPVALGRKGIKKPTKQTHESTPTPVDTSDTALLALLKRIKEAKDSTEIKRLSNQLERVIFHKQFKAAEDLNG